MAAYKLYDQPVTWTVDFAHAAKILVTKAVFSPPINVWGGNIYANGSLDAAVPIAGAAFSIGEVSILGAPYYSSDPGFTVPFTATLTHPGGTQTINFRLGEGTHVQPSVGTLTVTAQCEVWADLDTIGTGFVGFHHDGFERDTPDRKSCRFWLVLKEAATWSLVTNHATYSGTVGTTGDILDNTLTVNGEVTATAVTDTADGKITFDCTLGDYMSDTDGGSWSALGGTCTGDISSGVIEARATMSSGLPMESVMSCWWNLSRHAALKCAVLNTNGGGIAAELAIARYGDHTEPDTESCDSGGEYTEAIEQRAWGWVFEASRSGGGTGGATGGYSNWGNLAAGLNPAWSVGPEYQNLPDEFADPVYTPYLNWQDNRMLMKLWHTTGPAFAHASMSSLGLGWNEDGYSLSGSAYVANEPNRYGRWTASGCTMVDNTNSLLLTPAVGSDPLIIRRTLEWSVDQTGVSPTRSPRPTFAGYRYLYISLYRRNITPIPGDTVTVRIRQDDMAELFPDPALQTWDNADYRDKTYTGVVNSSGVVVIDLARPNVIGLISESDNPPPTGNYGELANPNTISRWPQPTMDGNLSGVTVPMWVEIEMPNPAGDVWELGSMELARLSEPKLYILPALNQWIREERHDLQKEGDTTARKHWRRRLVTGVCDGLPNLELFDMVRTSTHMVSEELGEYDTWAWTLKSVADTAVQAVEVHEHEHWIYNTAPTPDDYVAVGALERWPGWSASIPVPGVGSRDEWVLDGEGCRMGAHGVTWIGDTRTVQTGIALSSGTKVQMMADEMDWFEGMVDPFNMDDVVFTVRVATVLRGLAVGAGMPTEGANICTALATIESFTTDSHGEYAAQNPGGCHRIAHRLVRHGRTLVSWEPQVCTWTFRPSLYTTDIYELTEAPLWWHSRGVHVAHWFKLLGPPWIRHDRQGRILCQRAEFSPGGLCLKCRQGPGVT